MRAVLNGLHDLASGASVGGEFIGDYPPRRASLFLQQAPQQAFGGLGIAARPDDLIKGCARPGRRLATASAAYQ
jgi:hypothetical protein